jgi:RimJ/RimL family protein N-acetyltransferase
MTTDSRSHPKIILVLELNQSHREMMRSHLLDLGETDRRLRFGMHASDGFISGYVDSFKFDSDCFFGVIDSTLNIIGLAHLAYGNTSPSHQHVAEFGVSVSENGRGLGVGTALFKRSAIHARNTSITVLYVHCLSSNAAMMHIARKAGMSVEYSYGEADAYLSLPPSDANSLMIEALQDQSAIIDYSIKQGFKRAVLNSQLLCKSIPRLGI